MNEPTDPLCTCCSGDTTLKSEEDQPEHCELPSCSEAECCEPNGESSFHTGHISALENYLLPFYVAKDLQKHFGANSAALFMERESVEKITHFDIAVCAI